MCTARRHDEADYTDGKYDEVGGADRNLDMYRWPYATYRKERKPAWHEYDEVNYTVGKCMPRQ